MRQLHVTGTTVSYDTAGRGPALVLLHGTTNDGKSGFGHIVDCFTAKRTVVSVDYGGCGASTIPDGPLGLELLVEQVVAVIRAVPAEPVELLGFSLGAVVAGAVAAAYPELIERLVLVAGFVASDDARHQLVLGTCAHLMRT